MKKIRKSVIEKNDRRTELRKKWRKERRLQVKGKKKIRGKKSGENNVICTIFGCLVKPEFRISEVHDRN